MEKFELLREHQLAPAFRKALRRTSEGVLAVPFWGKGALKQLGLRGEEKVRVICNLDHPGCNPFVIEQLRKLKIKVRTHPRLHAKIYATAELAFVGSSNASTNGLTVEGAEARGWIELNVASSARDFVDGVLLEFETLWKSDETRPVRKPDIERAKKRRAQLPPTFFLPERQDLFEAARATPSAFSNAYLAVYDDGLSKAAKGRLQDVQKNAVPSSAGLDVRALKNAWGYQFERIPTGAWLIGLSCIRKPRFTGTAKSTGLTFAIPVGDDGEPENDLTIALRGPITVGGRTFRLTAGEKALLVKNAKRLLRASRGELLSLAKTVSLIDGGK